MTSLIRSIFSPASRQALASLLALALPVLALGAGCDDGAGSDAGTDAGEDMDAGRRDAGPATFPDGTIFCETDAECDDGVDCTRDSCGGTGTCRNVVDNAMCDDGIFCNGVEQCSPRDGCVPGPRETCNDDDVCTIDRCNEETKSCDRFPRDLDDDGDPDMFCEGGMDCDDTDPRASSLVNEVCDDFADNDCDGFIDAADPEGCGRPFHDVCEDTLDVSAGGYFEINPMGAAPDYTLSCGSFRHDVVAHFTLTEARSVRIEADGSVSTTGLSLRGPAANYTTCDQNDPPENEPACDECTDSSFEVGCDSGFPAVIRRRSLAPGTYFVIVGTNSATPVGLRIDFDVPTPPAANESCLNPLDVSAGGTFTDTTVEVRNDITTSCGVASAPDLMYQFTTTAPQNVQISVTEDGGAAMAYSVRSDCFAAATELRCESGAPASGTLHELPAGTYFIIVEGPTFRDADFTLDIQFLPPAPPPAGDVCATAIPIATDGTVVTGSLAGFQDDLAPTCGLSGDDVVYTFTLPAASDVSIEYDPAAVGAVSLRSNCTMDTGDIRCLRADPAITRVRNLAAGTYFLVLEQTMSAGYTISVDVTTPPTVPVNVTGNDSCTTAHPVPATGGLFTGSTVTELPDYMATCGASATSNDVVFELTLTSRQRVLASLEGSLFDTVLHLHNSTCPLAGEIACNDDANVGTLTSLLDRTLDPGTYYLVVDGFGAASAGTYFLDIRYLAP